MSFAPRRAQGRSVEEEHAAADHVHHRDSSTHWVYGEIVDGAGPDRTDEPGEAAERPKHVRTGVGRLVVQTNAGHGQQE